MTFQMRPIRFRLAWGTAVLIWRIISLQFSEKLRLWYIRTNGHRHRQTATLPSNCVLTWWNLCKDPLEVRKSVLFSAAADAARRISYIEVFINLTMLIKSEDSFFVNKELMRVCGVRGWILMRHLSLLRFLEILDLLCMYKYLYFCSILIHLAVPVYVCLSVWLTNRPTIQQTN